MDLTPMRKTDAQRGGEPPKIGATRRAGTENLALISEIAELL